MGVDLEQYQEEKWEVLEEFPLYAISSMGYITNLKRGVDLIPSPNTTGHLRVGLIDPHDGRQKTRSVSTLVATTFLPRPFAHWDTPIHKDGNKGNCSADNLVWRPRWYAIMYHKQFAAGKLTTEPQAIIEILSNTSYPNLYEAATDNGLLAFDVLKSAVENTHTPLTNQEFRFASML